MILSGSGLTVGLEHFWELQAYLSILKTSTPIEARQVEPPAEAFSLASMFMSVEPLLMEPTFTRKIPELVVAFAAVRSFGVTEAMPAVSKESLMFSISEIVPGKPTARLTLTLKEKVIVSFKPMVMPESAKEMLHED